MPQVYEVTARFRRQTQPVQYQAAEAELVVKAQFSEQEYQNGDSAKLLSEVQSTVLASLGLAVEATAPVNQGSGTAAGGGETQPKKVTRQTKVKTEEKPAETTSAAAAADMGDGAPAAKPPVQPAGVSDEDLQKTCSAATQRLGSAARVKELMKEFGVARLGELSQEKRADFIKKVDALKKE